LSEDFVVGILFLFKSVAGFVWNHVNLVVVAVKLLLTTARPSYSASA